MKYRIVEKIQRDGVKKYYPQYKRYWFSEWTSVDIFCHHTVTLEKAESVIKEHIEYCENIKGSEVVKETVIKEFNT